MNNMLKYLVKKVDNIHEHIGTFIRDTKIILKDK